MFVDEGLTNDISMTKLSTSLNTNSFPPAAPVARDSSIFLTVRLRIFCQYTSLTYFESLSAGNNPRPIAVFVIFSPTSFFFVFEIVEENAPKIVERFSRTSSKNLILALSTYLDNFSKKFFSVSRIGGVGGRVLLVVY